MNRARFDDSSLYVVMQIISTQLLSKMISKILVEHPSTLDSASVFAFLFLEPTVEKLVSRLRYLHEMEIFFF